MAISYRNETTKFLLKILLFNEQNINQKFKLKIHTAQHTIHMYIHIKLETHN